MINTPNSDRLIQSSGNDNSISGYNFVEPDLGIRWIESPFAGHRYSAPILNAQRRRKSMPRDLPLGNGKMLVAFDQSYQIRDLYWPHVGQENHALGHPFRTGVWVEGQFRWLDDGKWQRSMKYQPDTLVSAVRLVHHDLLVEIQAADMVDFHEDLCRARVEISNLESMDRV